MQLINLATSFEDTYGDDWVARLIEQGIPTAVLGIVTVFVVLSLIWGCLELFRYVFYTIPERNKNGGVKIEKTEVKESAPAKAAVITSNPDEEIVAAIIAAITAARAESGSAVSTAFRVVSFRKRK